jgi:hypothetical protein
MRSKSYSLRTVLFITCFGFLAGGCRKLYDYIHGHGDGDYKVCNIKKITTYYFPTFEGGKIDTLTYLFTYNRLGDPVSVINDHVGTGNGNYFFTYDKYNRLREFTSLYGIGGNSGYESWRKYGYNTQGQIVRDTTYIFGATSNGAPAPSPYYYYNDYTYDTQNRISSVTTASYSHDVLSYIDIRAYAYDAKGNLVNTLPLVYDDKLNLYRTNRLWMFLTRNYSVNNPFTATQYNAFGLPLAFDFQLILIGGPGKKTKVEYMCQ